MAKQVDVYDRLYRNLRADAMDAAGGPRAFSIVGVRFRTALVAQAILTYVDQQGVSITDSLARELVTQLRLRMCDDASLTEA